jgi:hypothetical protein
MDTSSITSSLGSLFSFTQTAGTKPPVAPAQAPSPASDPSPAATLGYRRTERAALYIVTQEGDVVRLRIKVRDALTAAASDGSADGTQVGQLAINQRSSLKVSFHVDGTLSADELDAIRSVVQQVGTLADQFFSGDVPAAFAAAQDLNIDGSQLAKVGLRISLRESFTYRGPALPAPAASAQVAAAPALALPAADGPSAAGDAASAAAAAQPAAAPAATDTTPPAADATPAAADASPAAQGASSTDAAPSAAPTDASQAPAAAAPTPSSATGDVLSTIAGFLHQLLDTLGAGTATTDSGSQASISLSLKLRIFAAAVVSLSNAAPTASDGTARKTVPLVGDTLDALAASQQPPLSTTA